ncbi:MAG: hypothetical protein K2P76_00970 [Lachnospiraceae bacterium]|nr:hypothetical protein [Lachnospiraceae bacterium]
MQEKETKTGGAGEYYNYQLRLSPDNPLEAQAIHLILERDKLDYPTVKSLLLKKILKSQEGMGASAESFIQQHIAGLIEEVQTLRKELDELKRGQSQAQEELPEIPAETETLQEEPDGQMDLSGFDAIADNLLSDME